jgi:3'(2'), 5'-bisphosphate nucleotidase
VQDLADVLAVVHELSVEAGERILAVYQRPDVEVAEKDDRSPLTEADLAANAHITARLKALTPDIPIVSEESDVETDAAEYWLVDPLDGTKEFLRRNGEFTTNVALIRDGRAVAGVVYAPVLGKAWLGAEGLGAWALDAAGTRTELGCGDASSRAAGVRAVTSRSHLNDETKAFLDALRSRGGEVNAVPMGSSIKICLVAEGAAEVYPRFGPTMHWDTAAAHAVVSAAGGTLTDRQGAPLRYVGPDRLNPSFLVCGAEGRDFWPA